MDFIAIDFEIANNKMSSACSLGMAFVDNYKIVDEKYFLIQPPEMEFDPKMVEIHGITLMMFKMPQPFRWCGRKSNIIFKTIRLLPIMHILI